MSIKPVSIASTLVKPNEVRDPGKNPTNNSNRFLVLRDRSRTPSVSGRGPPLSPAVKRRNEDDSAGNGKNPRMDSVFENMKGVELKIDKGKQAVAGIKVLLTKVGNGADDQLKELFGGLVDGLDGVFGILTNITSIIVDNAAPGKHSPRKEGGTGKTYAQSAAAKATAPPVAPTAEEVRKKKFVNAVKEAERSLLIFNLDLGKVPIMNTATIAKKVTEDITAKAAAVEGSDTGRPTEDTIMVLEDTLSVMKGMEFFGKATKAFRNKGNEQDTRNGSFHTLPVKMVFKDRDMKSKAESVLRTKCKVQCSTPYHIQLRKAIKALVDTHRDTFPENFIQVRVDAENLMLKVSRKCKADNKWINNYESVPITGSSLEIGKVDNVEGMDTGAGAGSSL